jgi:hypothetical protein
MREVASTSMRADITDRAKEDRNMATEGSQPLCWNSSGIWTRPGPVALLSSSAMPPVSVMTLPPKYFSSPSGTEPTLDKNKAIGVSKSAAVKGPGARGSVVA